jgi:phenylacetate-CoA ligase
MFVVASPSSFGNDRRVAAGRPLTTGAALAGLAANRVDEPRFAINETLPGSRDMYEQIFRQVLFPLYEGVVKRRNTHVYLAEYERSQWASPAELEALRLIKLNKLLAHCWEHVPFLARYWRSHGLDARPLSRVDDIARYPTIDKRLIGDNYEEMRAKSVGSQRLAKTTGGSTGDPFKFEYSEESYARRTAVMWRGYRWANADLGRRTAYLWGVGAPGAGLRGLKDRFYHLAFNRLFLSSFVMSDEKVGEYLTILNKFQPRIIVGYVAPLVLMAKWIVEHKAQAHRPLALISGAEPLTTPDREVIERAFGAPVFNTYGCREFMLLAAECSEHKGLHVSADHLIVETVDNAGRPVVEETGAVCVTDLHNFAMPFVRYLNGDQATLSTTLCRCGRSLPVFSSIDGRLLDVIVTPDGRQVAGEFFVYVMLEFPDIRRYQVVQNIREEVEIKVVRNTPLSDAEKRRLAAKIVAHMGPAMRVRIDEVDDIRVTPSGKRRVTVSNIRQ